MNTKELGNLGERIACEYLVKKGFKIMAKNYGISFGEIDIIARKKWNLLNLGKNSKTIHFIEVKTIIGDGKNFFPEERVDYKKRNKLRKLCLIWMENNKLSQNYPYQIDIIGILIDNYSQKVKVRYFSNSVEDKK